MSLPVVLLAGGLGTRLKEETEAKPKPMVEVGGHPLLWHIMKTYSSFGFNEFVICLGYKGNLIKELFLNYRSRQGSLTVDLEPGGADFIQGDVVVLERGPLEILADKGQLAGYRHGGFWQCMDTVRDLDY